MRTHLKNNSEVAHFWANNRQESGKFCNMFFEKGIIYSYGYHFPIAKHCDNNLILFTASDYSVSTSKHKNHVLQAIPSGYKVLTVPEIEISKHYLKDHIINVKYFISKVKHHLDKSTRARIYKTSHLQSVLSYTNQLREYLEIFRIKSKLEYKLKKQINILLNADNSEILNQIKKENHKQRLIEKEQEKKRADKLKLKMPEWKNGDCYSLPYSNRHYLRLIGDPVEIETSLHVKISVELFLKYAGKLKNNENLIGAEIDGWNVTGLNADFITIGCHKIPLTEIGEISNQLKKEIL